MCIIQYRFAAEEHLFNDPRKTVSLQQPLVPEGVCRFLRRSIPSSSSSKDTTYNRMRGRRNPRSNHPQSCFKTIGHRIHYQGASVDASERDILLYAWSEHASKRKE